MKITKKAVKIGGSIGVIIDKSILKRLKIEKGDFIEVNIKKVEE